MSLIHPPSLEDIEVAKIKNQFSYPPEDPFFAASRLYFITYIMGNNRWTLEVDFLTESWRRIRGWRDKAFHCPIVCRGIRDSSRVSEIHGFYLTRGSRR